MSRRRTIPDGSGLCRACGHRTATMSIATCPSCGAPIFPSQQRPQRRRRIRFFSVPQMLYQRPYKWFVYISALDVVFTWLILLLGGREVNLVADAVIAYAGLKGILIYKFCLVVLVVLLCEVIGRRRPRTGRRLARWSVAITALPVILSVMQLFARGH